MALFRKRSEPVAKQAAEPSNFAELANRGLYKANGLRTDEFLPGLRYGRRASELYREMLMNDAAPSCSRSTRRSGRSSGPSSQRAPTKATSTRTGNVLGICWMCLQDLEERHQLEERRRRTREGPGRNRGPRREVRVRI